MGPRLPPNLHATRVHQGEIPLGSGDGAHRNRRPHNPRRHRAPAPALGSSHVHRLVRPPQHILARYSQPRQQAQDLVYMLHDRPLQPRLRNCLLHIAPHGRERRQRTARPRLPFGRLPRRTIRYGTQPRAGSVHQRRCPGYLRHRGLRNGYRQEQHPLDRPQQHARQHRELLSGDGVRAATASRPRR